MGWKGGTTYGAGAPLEEGGGCVLLGTLMMVLQERMHISYWHLCCICTFPIVKHQQHTR